MYETYITLGKGIQQISFSLMIGFFVINTLQHGFSNVNAQQSNTLLIKSLVIVNIFVTFFMLLIQTSYYLDNYSYFLNISALKNTIINTRFGNFWAIKMLLILILVVFIFNIRFFSLKIIFPLICIISSIGAFTGHAISLEYKVISIPVNMIHIICINIWFGSLPFLYKNFLQKKNNFRRVLASFSVIASICMFLIIFTGIILSFFNLDYSFAALLGTKYGFIILLKLLTLTIVLTCAVIIRFFYLNQNKKISIKNILKIEILFAFLTFLLGIILSQTIPGAHDEINWPLSYRISTDVAFEDKWVVNTLKYIYIFCFTIFGILITDYIFNKNLRRFISILGVLFVISTPITIVILSVEAYPVTYKTPSIPYSAISVLNGKKLYLENCTSCHGKTGLGDGELAKKFKDIPPANLTEPHTSYHTAGDIFWWLTYGKPPSSMPGFADILSEDDRWDIINFLRTLSAGYEGRIISENVIRNKPWLPSIDFNYVTLDKKNGRLSKYRFKKTVLLVFFNLNEVNKKHIIHLNNNNKSFKLNNIKLILIPNFDNNNFNNINKLNNFVIKNKILIPIIFEGSKEITETYKLYRRTLENPDIYDEKENLNYMEILIDKYGYVRARRFLENNMEKKYDDKFFEMISELSLEEQILPPPDEHVH